MACNTYLAAKDGREFGWAGIGFRATDCVHHRTKAPLPKGWYVDLMHGRGSATIAQGMETHEEAQAALRAYLRDPYLPERVAQ